MKAFPPKERQGVYRAILNRRDVRMFRPDPVPHLILARLLRAAHHGPVVDYMPPWNFIVVTDVMIKHRVQALAAKGEESAASDIHGERCTLKLEGLLAAPVHLCVTCDPTRFGPGLSGRHTIREADLFSVFGAVEDLWLAARAEGIGVGWVSTLRNEELQDILGIPPPVFPVAYLCIGYAHSVAERRLRETAGEAPRLDLTEVVYMNVWGGREGIDDLIGHLREEGKRKCKP